jgi:hypothetical protein
VPAVAGNPKLLALAEELKPIWAQYLDASGQSRQAYEEARDAAMAFCEETTGDLRGWGLDPATRQKFEEVGEANGYSSLQSTTDDLWNQIDRIADAILEIASTHG